MPYWTQAIYRPKPGKERAVLKVLQQNWVTLHETGLVTDDFPVVYRVAAKPAYFVELLAWKTANGNKKVARPAWDEITAVEPVMVSVTS